jgi:hypothetical protein
MAENEKSELVAGGVTDAEHAATAIAYCPHLGMYHYWRADGSEFMFDRVELLQSLEAYSRSGDTRQGEFMAGLTGHARRYPHVIVIVRTDGTYALQKLEIPEDERGESGIVDDISSSEPNK